MTLNVPQSDVVLPEDIKRAVENARNNVTVAEAEVNRLRGLVVSMEYTIGENNKTIKDLEDKIATLKEQENELTLNADILASKAVKAQGDLDVVTEQLDAVNAQIKAIEDSIKVKTDQLNEKEAYLNETGDSLLKRADELKNREDAVLVKEKAIEDFKSKL